MYQFREWLRAASTFGILLCAVALTWATIADPPRVLHGGPGLVADANLYCAQVARDRAAQLVTRDAQIAVSVDAQAQCLSRSTVDFPRLLLQAGVALALLVVFLVVLFRVPQ